MIRLWKWSGAALAFIAVLRLLNGGNVCPEWVYIYNLMIFNINSNKLWKLLSDTKFLFSFLSHVFKFTFAYKIAKISSAFYSWNQLIEAWVMTIMRTLKIGQQVTLAAMGQQVFVVTAVNIDGSFTVETKLADQQKLSYDNVAFEMLKILPPKI